MEHILLLAICTVMAMIVLTNLGPEAAREVGAFEEGKRHYSVEYTLDFREVTRDVGYTLFLALPIFVLFEAIDWVSYWVSRIVFT